MFLKWKAKILTADGDSRIKSVIRTFAIGCVVGTIVFFLLCGYKILNPLYVDWIISDVDFALPYYGLRFYLRTNGGVFDAIQGMTYPYGISPIFTDMVMPVSALLKIFDGILPNNIQCQGIITLSFFILQGGFAGVLFHKFIQSRWIQILGEVLVCLSPWMLARIFAHYTLGAHWLVLAAFAIWIYKRQLGNKSNILWCILVPFAALHHVYYVPMLMGIMFFSYAEEYKIKNKEWIKFVGSELIAGLCSLFVVWLFNGFDTTISVPDQEYFNLGKINANLNTFINPLEYSAFFRGYSAPEGYVFQGFEGFGYLGGGLGVIILIDILLVIYKRKTVISFVREYKRDIIPFVICFSVFVAMAIGFYVTCFRIVIVEIPIPVFLRPVIATFRSIGRYIWIPCYIIMFTSLIILFKLLKMVAEELFALSGNIISGVIPVCVVSFVLILQIADLRPLLSEKHKYAGEKVVYESLMTDKKWQELADSRKYVVVIPSNCIGFENPQVHSMDLFVLDNNLSITSFYVAHRGTFLDEVSEQHLKDITEGKADPDAIYWFGDTASYETSKPYIHCENLDGYLIGWVAND